MTEPTLQEQTILILNTLANQVEWCVGVPGSPSIDRDREVDAINDAQTALTALIEKAERKAEKNIVAMFIEWQHKNGWIDSDWYTEEPYPYDEFFKELKEKEL